jgi:predicted Zn-dependent peptidase
LRKLEQAKLVIGCRTGTTLSSPDYAALMVYNGLLGGFPHSRLFLNVREKEGLAYYASSGVEGSRGLMFLSCGIDFASYEKCLPVIRAQMDDLSAGHIGDEEWNKTVTSLVDRVCKWNDDPAARMGAFTEMVLNGVARTPAQVIEHIRSLTRDQVAAAGRRVRWDTIYLLTKP